ncbi:hypothetical protein CCHR01_11472 [Colletotrichum chrysophilum]|uniref:Uncharacterized protein n=1 Tax=Colletotrichum chrysophilum TaxID=1836956 RepID=A0AAD9ECB9_9PEZI|nr:hypothetical protein CCHR01_11472 [Colletotrichum chrysophilum]
MNRNRNRNASPAAKSEIGCRCSQTHSRSTHTLTHLHTRGGRAGRDYGRLFDDGAHAHWTIAHEGAISQPNQHGHKSRFAALLFLPFAVDVTFEHRPRRRLPFPSLTPPPPTSQIAPIANNTRRYTRMPLRITHFSPRRFSPKQNCDAIRSLARSLSSKQHPSNRTGYWPPPLRKDEMQYASLFANAARRTPYAHAHATPRYAAAVRSPGTLNEKGAHGKVDATQHTAFPARIDRRVRSIQHPTSINSVRQQEKKVRVRVVSPVRRRSRVSPS